MLESTVGMRSSGDYRIGIFAIFVVTTLPAIILSVCSAIWSRIWTGFLPFVAIFVMCFALLLLGGALLAEIVQQAYNPAYTIGLAGIFHEISKLVQRDGWGICISALLGTFALFVSHLIVAQKIKARQK
jgi:cobalamin biosynthesis protein CobD/CbiB